MHISCHVEQVLSSRAVRFYVVGEQNQYILKRTDVEKLVLQVNLHFDELDEPQLSLLECKKGTKSVTT